jgi:inositol transport system ATP-binding protein
MEPLLDIDRVRKSFPGVVALDDVSLRVERGRVHALMGENGAGKSTLVKVIAGILRPDAGRVNLRGRAALIHQELNLLAPMTVAENIWLGREPLTRIGFVDDRALRARTADLLGKLSLPVNPDDRVGDLPLAARQMVEIARAISHNPDLLIMDEPTSALSEREVEQLFSILSDLKARGAAIIYITHKIAEVFAIADDVSVLRDGRLVGSGPAAALDRDTLISMMVGRELTQLFPKNNVPSTTIALSVKGLTRAGAFADVSFDLRAGEILGVAGLVGSGRTEIAEAVFGLKRLSSGSIEIGGDQVEVDSPSRAIARGMAFVTEDRKESGLFLPLSTGENMEVTMLGATQSVLGFVRQKSITAACAAMAERLRIRMPGLFASIANLSGGNQQKTVVGRWLLSAPRILILDEPTRGIDVGAKAEIHGLISNLAAAGAAVLMISSELPEIVGMSDRVLVMRQGRVAGVLEGPAINQVDIMRLAAN